MCGIASLFLLQRLKRSILRDARDFNNMGTRALIKFFLANPKEFHAILRQILGKHAPLCATIKNCVTLFKRGDSSTCVAPHPGRPKTVTTSDSIDRIHELILEDFQISAKPLTEQLGISRERVESIIHEDLDTRNLSAKWVQKCLNANQKRKRCQSSE